LLLFLRKASELAELFVGFGDVGEVRGGGAFELA
jgi:hypothetical protein